MNSNNTVYVPNRFSGQIHIWTDGSNDARETISGNFTDPYSIFATSNGDIYIDNGGSNGQVDKWTSSTKTWTTVMYVSTSCYGLFVDLNNTLYCSMHARHLVMKRWLGGSTNTSVTAAGNRTRGNASNMLYNPSGIFVDTNFDLYVADCDNHRIQLFPSDEQNGRTVAGAGSSSATISLERPSGIVLDADKHIFIVDQNHHRIVASGPNGFRCIVGCFGYGSKSNQLAFPGSLSFDRYGNLFVADQLNSRIQKFVLSTNSCGKCESIELKESYCKRFSFEALEILQKQVSMIDNGAKENRSSSINESCSFLLR